MGKMTPFFGKKSFAFQKLFHKKVSLMTFWVTSHFLKITTPHNTACTLQTSLKVMNLSKITFPNWQDKVSFSNSLI